MNNNPELRNLLIKHLKLNPTTCHDLASIVRHDNVGYIQSVIQKLHNAGEIYIYKWEHNPDTRRFVRVYHYGTGEDVEKPVIQPIKEPISSKLVMKKLLNKLKIYKKQGNDNLFTPLLFLTEESVLSKEIS